MEDNLGWVKIHRKFLNWEWFSDEKILKFFLFCLLKANYEDKKWKGLIIKRGSFVASLQTLSAETNISEKRIRNIIQKLISTNEICQKTTNRFRIITICNYDNYQSQEVKQGQAKGKQRANKGQTKGNKQEYKEYKKEKNIESTLANFSEEQIKNYDKFLSWSKENIPNVSKMQKPLSIVEYFKLKNNFPSQFVITLLYKMDNYKDIKKKNVSTYRTFLNWAERE